MLLNTDNHIFSFRYRLSGNLRVMPRLFLGNFDFEHRLSEPTQQPPLKLARLNAELASAWLSIANDGDWIWTPQSIDIDFFRHLESEGLPRVIPVRSLSEVPRGVECVPWGWSTEIRNWVKKFGWTANAPSDLAVRMANSRATSAMLESQWNVGLPEARRVETLSELRSSIRSLPASDSRWVVKAEFSMSARERILGRGPLSAAEENWVQRRLISHGVVFFEPWVERIGEIGIQIDVPPQGDSVLNGITPMLVDGRGQYAGSWFAYSEARFAKYRRLWSEAVEVALRAAKYLQLAGYFGPLGIDSMIYRSTDNSEHLRPLQDVNARWTMGRLSLGWRRLLEPGEEGLWQHGSVNASETPTNFEVRRRIVTGPEKVGEALCHHMSHVIIG